jgi:hypothetical protein
LAAAKTGQASSIGRINRQIINAFDFFILSAYHPLPPPAGDNTFAGLIVPRLNQNSLENHKKI